MNLSPQQQDAVAAVRDWLASGGDRPFYLAGYAGTGKTTLARILAEEVDGRVIFAAYTGKAALVLRRAGCDNAQTLHSLIYVPVERDRSKLDEVLAKMRRLPDESPEREDLEAEATKLRRALRVPAFTVNEASDLAEADLLVVDEVSMVDERMGKDVLSFDRPVLVLGDPAQLPPVGNSAGFFTKREPDVMLTEVHRQAKDSPILEMATRVRSGKRLDLGHYGPGCEVVRKGTLSVEQAFRDFDQIICGKNATRKAINDAVRSYLGRPAGIPVEGDRLICTRNDKETGMLNGSFWAVTAARVDESRDQVRLSLLSLDRDDPQPSTAVAHLAPFQNRDLPYWDAEDAVEMDFGYAITCHKAQGSQWPRVLVYDQSWIARKDRHRWLYTALTRASVAATVVQL